MRSIFLILGYGIPKDILKDDNYKTYLRSVFNNIYSIVQEQKNEKPIIIFSGGKTDIFKPYKRDEAREMIKFFQTICQRIDLKKQTKKWQIINESNALSTLENLIDTKEKLAKIKIKKGEITIFCEATRKKKVDLFAKKVFPASFKVKIEAIDFDLSPSRYLDQDFIKQKELQDIKLGLWALKSQENFKKYHQMFVDRMKYFRRQGPRKHIKSIHQWWQDKLNELKI